MRLVPRTDLGGYAAGLDTLAAAAGTGIERPFLLLCGPNGSGKTALLGMLRAATGLTGDRSGRPRDGYGAVGPTEVGDDLGKLAAYERAFGDPRIPKDGPGVLDVVALGWRGQRTWTFSARAETTLLNRGHFEDGDFMHHVAMLTNGAGKRSHGQFLANPWLNALRFALGIIEGEDAYDSPGTLPPAQAEIARRLFPEGRSTERWLLLDEPETALDAEALYVGLSLLVEAAEPGKLRVFCASHSPLFAAGLAKAPTVQVLDLGGRRPWLAMQERTLREVADPARVAGTGVRLAQVLREQHAGLVAEERAKQAREAAERAKEIGKAGRDLLVEVLAAGEAGLTVANGSRKSGTASDLGLSRLVRQSYAPKASVVTLTQAGRDLAEQLAANPAPARKPRRPKAPAGPPAP